MRVNLFTSHFGGPYQWGQDLRNSLKGSDFFVRHINTAVGCVFRVALGDCEVVHTTVPLPDFIWRKPTIVTVKGDFTKEIGPWQRYYPSLLRGAKMITTPSKYLKGKIGREDVMVIPNGVVSENFPVVQHRSKSHINLVTVMNFYFREKSRGLLRTLDILNQSGFSRFTYIIVGDGPYLYEVKEYAAKLKLDVRFSGLLEYPQLALGGSDIFLYYSHHDNFPNVILEAMASGLPVLTNEVGAVREIITSGSDGFVASNDAEYREIMCALLRSVSLRQEIGGSARQSVEQKFDWKNLSWQYRMLYEGVGRGYAG